MNQPTGQFYRVALDNDFPYHIYGAQQDNTTVETSSRGNTGAITESDWHEVGGGESGWIAPDPTDTRFVYAGSYDGLLTRYDNRTGGLRNVTVWPDNPMGSGVEAMKYRFQWSFPLLFSTQDPKLLYAGSNVLLGTRDEGHSWQVMSPDLTRNDKSKQGPVGGPLTKDNTAVEYYDTIYTLDESTVAKGVIWVGSDDGLIHLTRDDGKNWENVTPKDIPDFIRINCIAASPFDGGTAYVAATMYLSDDYRPFLYKTTDYGKTWTKIANGIPDDDFTRTIRPDPKRKGLLIAGTEAHLYISYDDGESWAPFQLNLPNVPMTDIAFQKQEDDLVVATQGRGFYVLDDMPLIRQLATGKLPDAPLHLFAPKPAYRYIGGGGGFGPGPVDAGTNPPSGVVLYYALKAKPTSDVTIRVKDASGTLVNEFSSKPEKKTATEPEENEERRAPAKPTALPGMNRFVWDLRYADATKFPGMILWAGNTRGPMAVPGTYTVEVSADGHTETQTAVVLADPRVSSTPEDYRKQLELALQIRDKFSAADQAVIDIRGATHQLDSYTSATDPKIAAQAKDISERLGAIEDAIYQTKLRANEDALNFPIRINNKLASLLSTVMSSDTAPTQASYEVFTELSAQLQVQLDRLKAIDTKDISAFNKLVREGNVPAVTMKTVR
jgi:WD40 repeat protein